MNSSCPCASESNLNSPGAIRSWIDIQHLCPKNPLDLIAYAKINTLVGVYGDVSSFSTPSAGWITSPFSIAGSPVCIARGSDNLLNVANATDWNFSHPTANLDSTLTPVLRKVIFLRGGTDWQMNIPLDLGEATYNDLQLSFRDNAGTRGDIQGTVPVISFGGGNFTGLVTLSLVTKIKCRVSMALRAIDTNNNWSMFEMEWIVTD